MGCLNISDGVIKIKITNHDEYVLYFLKDNKIQTSLLHMGSYCSANKQPASSISVVKLFNAVSKHQKEMESKLTSAPTEAKKSKGKRLQH